MKEMPANKSAKEDDKKKPLHAVMRQQEAVQIGKMVFLYFRGRGDAFLLGLLRGSRVDGFVRRTGEFGFELFTSLLEFTHALSEAAGKGGKLFGTEEDQYQHGDDNHFRCAEGAESEIRDVHGTIHTFTYERVQWELS